MKTLSQYLHEALKIGSKTDFDGPYTEEELLKDYMEVADLINKADKIIYADKYGAPSWKIRDIQLTILDKLRDIRNKKKKFTWQDVTNFIRYELPMKYEEYEKWLDKESEDFIEYLLNYYEEKLNNFLRRRGRKLGASQAEAQTLKRVQQLKKYLGK